MPQAPNRVDSRSNCTRLVRSNNDEKRLLQKYNSVSFPWRWPPFCLYRRAHGCKRRDRSETSAAALPINYNHSGCHPCGESSDALDGCLLQTHVVKGLHMDGVRVAVLRALLHWFKPKKGYVVNGTSCGMEVTT